MIEPTPPHRHETASGARLARSGARPITAASTAADGESEPYTPGDFAVPASAAARIDRSVPANTRSAYASRWRSFTTWCAAAGRVPLPATAQTLAAYLDHLAGVRGCKASTLDAHLAAIRTLHRAAGHTPPDVLYARKVIVDRARESAARPDLEHGPRKALALTISELRAIIACLDAGTALGLRTRAVILLGFALLARRSELAALNLTDLRHAPGQGLAVTLRRSKTDQAARGVTRYVHYGADPHLCPVRAVLSWRDFLAEQGVRGGPLFVRLDRWGNLGPEAGGHYSDPRTRDGRLRPQAIGALVTSAARGAGLTAVTWADVEEETRAGASARGRGALAPGDTGERTYTGHSLRRGGATAMLAAGADPLTVCRHGRWADGSRSFAGYIEEATGFGAANPTQGLL